MYRGSQKNASKKCKLPHRHAKLPAVANEFKQVCRRDTIEAHILERAGIVFDATAEPGKLRMVT